MDKVRLKELLLKMSLGSAFDLDELVDILAGPTPAPAPAANVLPDPGIVQ